MPQQPKTEIQFKKAYARTASAAGLTKEQVVRVYAFELGGNGRYDVQAGSNILGLTPGPSALRSATTNS